MKHNRKPPETRAEMRGAKTSLAAACIKSILKENKASAGLLCVAVLASAALSLIPPQLLRTLIDVNLVPGVKDGLGRTALLYMGVLCLAGAFDFLKGALLTVFGQKIVRDLRMRMTAKLERIGAAYFSANPPAAVASRIVNDVENVNSLFAEGIVSMAADCFKIIGIVASVWIFSWKLGAAVLGIIPLIYGITRAFQKRMLQAQIQNLEQQGKVSVHLSESIKNAAVIKAFHIEAYMGKKYQKKLEDNYRTVEKVNFYDSGYSPVIQILRAAVIALIVFLSSGKLPVLGLTLGMAAASIDLVSNLFSPIETLGAELQNVQKGISGIRRINAFYREPEEPPKDETITVDEMIGKNKRAAVIFENVSFAYEEDQTVLENLNLRVDPGSAVTFSGRTGVGKTTLFRLVMGLWRPTGGRILIGGKDACDIPNTQKRRIFGFVEQQFTVVPGTVAQQITLGDERISREQVIEAVRFVGLHDAVMQMENGYDTKVRADVDFSQGQKQLLAIARAIVSDPAILLLDEVTSNLDLATEAQIFRVLRKAGRGRTVLSISHRITSMLQSDFVVLIENGCIAASGPPREVLAARNLLGNQLLLEQNRWIGRSSTEAKTD